MNRAEALRVLGVADTGTHDEVLAAFARLSAHLEARGARASNLDERAASLGQIATLRRALDLPSSVQPKPFDTRITIAAAVGALALLLLAGWWIAPREWRSNEPNPPAASAALPPVPAEPGRLSVIANVVGAAARITTRDGRELAVAPADGTPIEVPAGELHVTVSHPDCRIGFEHDTTVASGRDHALEAVICPETGWLVVRSNQLRDTFSVDGVTRGATGTERHPVRAGRRTIKVSKPGFIDWATTASVTGGSEVTVRARLARIHRPDPVVAEEVGPGGSRGWHQAVSRSMVRRYDLDLSGLIDTDEEVVSVPCSEWLGLEESYETGGLSIPMTRLYGFDGSRWVKDALGIDLRVRSGSYTRMRACGLR